jgi:ABC-type polysaccharide/polyol phosphate export permease
MVTDAQSRRLVPVYDSGAFRIPLFHGVADLFKYRFLVWNMIARDLKVRYKRSVLGFVWVMLNPLLTMGVMAVVFSQLFRFNVNHYVVFLLCGILIWTLYAQGSIAAMSGVQGNGHILRKLYVPPSAFVSSAVGSALVNLVFALGPFLLLAYLDGVVPAWSWLFLPVPVLLTTAFSLGMGFILAPMLVFFNDTFEIYQVLLNLYYFLTPVFYPLKILPPPLRTFEQYNPMYLFLDITRVAIINKTLPNLSEIGIASALAFGVLMIGWTIFTRLEDRFVYYF